MSRNVKIIENANTYGWDGLRGGERLKLDQHGPGLDL